MSAIEPIRAAYSVRPKRSVPALCGHARLPGSGRHAHPLVESQWASRVRQNDDRHVTRPQRAAVAKFLAGGAYLDKLEEWVNMGALHLVCLEET